MARNLDLQNDTKLAYKVQKYKCMYCKACKQTFVLPFSKNVFYPNQTFLRLDFSLFSLRGFDNVLERAFLNVLFFMAMLDCSLLSLYLYHQYTFL